MKKFISFPLTLFSAFLFGKELPAQKPLGVAGTSAADHKYQAAASGLLGLFRQRSLVALDEGHHQSSLFHEFLQELIAHPKFPDTVNDIVVEFGSARYQQVMDDFLLGKDIPDSILRLCWRQTTQVLVWDNPVYEQFFRKVRSINSKLPEHKKIRVLLGDPPINWNTVQTITDWASQAHRDAHAAQLVAQQVLYKKRKALIIYGGMHLMKKSQAFNFGTAVPGRETLGELLASRHPFDYAAVWTRVNTNDSLVAQLLKEEINTAPRLIYLKTHPAGRADFSRINDIVLPRMQASNGTVKPVPLEAYKAFAAARLFDAILVLGPLEALQVTAAPQPSWFQGAGYLDELVRRCRILQHPDLPRLLELQQARKETTYACQ